MITKAINTFNLRIEIIDTEESFPDDNHSEVFFKKGFLKILFEFTEVNK